jgi:VanZ family protein
MSTRTKHLISRWLPLIIYCLIIFIQSSQPAYEHLPEFKYSDKFLHFSAYAVLGILFFRAFQTLGIKTNIRLLILLSIVSASLYGISDEIHQYFVPFRNADLLDVLANTLGAVCGVYLYHLWVSRKQAAGCPK